MADFTQQASFDLLGGAVLSTHQVNLGGVHTGNPGSTAWPSADLAIFIPVRVFSPVTVCKLVVGAGSTAAGNFDVGIYDSSGNRLVASGATAKQASVEQVIDVTDTPLAPGLYYLALAADGTNNYICWVPSTEQKTKMMGLLQAASSYPLPATATYAACSNAPIPAIGAYLRSY